MTGPGLARVLRQGPFEAALGAAIDRSGMTLDRICERLAGRGSPISRATLSYWRSGRSRPERAGSLDALTQLEAVLGLPPASLVALLGPRRDRGRWIDHPPGTLTRHALWPAAGPMLDHLAAPREGEVVIRSVHDILTLRADRSEESMRVRLLIEATVDDTYRLPVYYEVEEPGREAPRLDRVWLGGRPGRAIADRRSGLTVAEVIFDRPLRRGERTLVDYEMAFTRGVPVRSYHRRFARPVTEYALIVDFGGSPPARCHRFTQRTPADREQPAGEVWIGGTGVVQTVAVDQSPGIIGLRWE